MKNSHLTEVSTSLAIPILERDIDTSAIIFESITNLGEG